MIEVESLTKLYGDFRALDDVSFSVRKGEVVAFLGPNGAGKSTTMKILTGYIAPDGGAASIGGVDVVRESLAVRKRIGYLPETTPLYYDMQVNEFLSLAARLRGLGGSLKRGRLGWVADTCFLGDFWRKPIGYLSRGQKQRVGFAAAIMHDPDVLILDEPTAGLDPIQIQEVRALIRSFAGEKTIILSTHILQEVHAVCDHVVMIDAGQIVADSSVDELESAHGSLEGAFLALTTLGRSESAKLAKAAAAGEAIDG
ncbi:MAG: ABC transporter ATP-binding protein [Planctomycetota bacterium]|jgi:ABC-2 type transport system ATP-binding protein